MTRPFTGDNYWYRPGSFQADTRLAVATAAKTGSTTTAIINGYETTIQVVRDLTVAAGDLLFVAKFGSQWFAVGRGYTNAVGSFFSDPPPPPTPAARAGATLIAPIETRTYRNPGGWLRSTSRLYMGRQGGVLHTGCAFYGNKPSSLAGVQVTKATIRVQRFRTGGKARASSTTLAKITQKTRPNGAPTLGTTTDGPNLKFGQDIKHEIPTSWGQELVDGTIGGIALYDADGSPYMVFDGRGQWSPAMMVTISWLRPAGT